MSIGRKIEVNIFYITDQINDIFREERVEGQFIDKHNSSHIAKHQQESLFHHLLFELGYLQNYPVEQSLNPLKTLEVYEKILVDYTYIYQYKILTLLLFI
jgi:hypothetical protein